MSGRRSTPKHRNPHAIALHARAGNAGQAVAVDTRPKVIQDKRRGTRQAGKAALRRSLAEA